MELVFIYTPTRDLAGTLPFYRDELGLDEAWREGEDTVAFRLPGQRTQLMVSTTDQPAGPMYLVPDAAAWMAEHPAVQVLVPLYEIPGGRVGGFRDTAGNVFYVFDQAAGG